MSTVGYVRVSTRRQVQRGQGLRIQREKIRQYCGAHNLALLGIYEDRGISGAKADEESLIIDRDGLQSMLADIPHQERKSASPRKRNAFFSMNWPTVLMNGLREL